MFRLGIRQPGDGPVTGTTVMMDDEAATNNTAPGPSSNDNVDANSATNPNGAENQSERQSQAQDQEDQDLSQLKKTGSGIILHPQPEDNPNDPLNWPLLRKDLCFLIIGLQTFIGGGQTPILAAGFKQLSVEFDKTVAVISYFVGAYMLALGLGSVFASPTAILYGKRLVYILGIVVFLVGAIVCAASTNYGGLMAGRILTGFGASPTESLASASLSELYFQHERAYRTGLYTLLLLGGKNILPLLSSLVFQHLDRHWLYWIESMFLALTLVLTFLFVPETYWDRGSAPEKRDKNDTPQHGTPPKNETPPNNDASTLTRNTPSSDTTSVSSSRVNETLRVPSREKMDMYMSPSPSGGSAISHAADSAILPKSFRHRLHIVSGRHSADKWWMVALRPVYLYAYPSVFYGAIVYSLAVVWLIVISEVLAEIFQAQDYGYSSQTVGLFYISPFVGGILGSLCAGIFGDMITRVVVRRNHGIYEPEFRLFMLVPSTVFTCMGLMGYGWSSYERDVWIAPVLFFGCLSFGSSMASTTAITYTIDCYKMFAAEALVSFNFAKNVLGFIFSLFNNDAFLTLHGKRLFVVYGCVQLLVSLLGVVVYIYGKVFRAWTDEKKLLKSLYHEDTFVSESEIQEM